MELLLNFLLDHVGLHVVIVDVLELNEVVILKSLSGHISAVSWVVNSGLGVNHSIKLLDNVVVLLSCVLKVLIKDISSL